MQVDFVPFQGFSTPELELSRPRRVAGAHGCPGGQDALIPEEMVALLASAKACFNSTIGGTSTARSRSLANRSLKQA